MAGTEVVEAPAVADIQDAFTAQFLAATNAQLGREAAPASAPTDGNAPDQASPLDGQPAAPAPTPAAPPPTPDAAQKPQEESALSPEDEQTILERAGIATAEPETVETIKVRYAESTKEAKRLAAEMQSVESTLAKVGLQLAVDRDGKTVLKATDKYKAEMADKDILDVYAGLSDEEKALAVEDSKAFATLIAKKTAADILAKRPPASLPREAVTPASEGSIQEAKQALLDAKLRDGSPRYEGVKEADKLMYNILVDPATPDSFRELFHRDTKWAMQALHAMAYRALAPVIAARKQAAVSGVKPKPAAHPPIASDSASVGHVVGQSKQLTDAEYAQKIRDAAR